MTRDQIEHKILELIHQQPFMPFAVEMANGAMLVVPHPRLAVNTTGAGFIDPDGGLVDIDFAQVRAIHLVTSKVGT